LRLANRSAYHHNRHWFLLISGSAMATPTTTTELLDLVRKSGVVEATRLDPCLAQLSADGLLPEEPVQLAAALVCRGVVTRFQAKHLLQGRWRGLQLGKYLILEQLGSGGMGIVYLAEHRLLHRRVALKILPVQLARDPWFLEQFYHEARAIAALQHPNIVRAHDVDREGELHFLVMEYVDGASLQTLVEKHGPLPVLRAAHYVSQAARGLQHAFQAGLVHRDVKPGNLLLDRQGTVKVSDLGLACFLRDRPEPEPKDRKAQVQTLGTDDYLAPEQVVDSDAVDIRADVYGLGATFYFLLTGRPPFPDVELPWQKLVSHLTRRPRPIAQFRPDVPADLAAVVEKMLAKNPWERYQTPAAVAEALAAWTRTPIPPPGEEEMPSRTLGVPGAGPGSSHPATAAGPASSTKKSWVVYAGRRAAEPGSTGPGGSR
jgi:serine/threonine protein kinase